SAPGGIVAPHSQFSVRYSSRQFRRWGMRRQSVAKSDRERSGLRSWLGSGVAAPTPRATWKSGPSEPALSGSRRARVRGGYFAGPWPLWRTFAIDNTRTALRVSGAPEFRSPQLYCTSSVTVTVPVAPLTWPDPEVAVMVMV